MSQTLQKLSQGKEQTLDLFVFSYLSHSVALNLVSSLAYVSNFIKACLSYVANLGSFCYCFLSFFSHTYAELRQLSSLFSLLVNCTKMFFVSNLWISFQKYLSSASKEFMHGPSSVAPISVQYLQYLFCSRLTVWRNKLERLYLAKFSQACFCQTEAMTPWKGSPKLPNLDWRHDTHQNDILHNDTQCKGLISDINHNDTQH
jgi:hypothetical protein